MNSVFDLDYGEGQVKYIELDLVNTILLEDQIESLREDLLQVSYGDDKYILDVGWFPEGELDGSFRVVIIENYNWDQPIFIKRVNSIDMLIEVLAESVEILKRH